VASDDVIADNPIVVLVEDIEPVGSDPPVAAITLSRTQAVIPSETPRTIGKYEERFSHREEINGALRMIVCDLLSNEARLLSNASRLSWESGSASEPINAYSDQRATAPEH
jgi:hypothetical protein